MFLDIAHRKPTLVTKLFAENPDLLMVRYFISGSGLIISYWKYALQEPLEANPILLTTFLAMHRNQLPDLSDPNFEAMLFHIQSKKSVDACVQTEKLRLNSNAGKRASGAFLLGERNSLLRLVTDMERTVNPAPDTERKASNAAISSKFSSGCVDLDTIPSASEVASEIIRLYVSKIIADARDDATHRKRQILHCFVLVRSSDNLFNCYD